MWEYILATRAPSTREENGFLQIGEYYTIPQLVVQYNRLNKTQFEGTIDGWLKHEQFGSCHIKTLDGMCGVLMAHKLNIDSEDIPKYYPLLKFMAQKGNYTYITMSNVQGNRLRAWKEQGFTTMLAFQNRRTLNNVELLIKKVPYETQ